MQESPQCVDLFRALLNPEMTGAEVDASAAMIAAARETRWRRNQPCDAVIARGAVACVLAGASVCVVSVRSVVVIPRSFLGRQ